MTQFSTLVRPNRIGLSCCRVLGIDGLRIRLEGLDAIDGTPVLDFKLWVREFSPRGEVKQPEWMQDHYSTVNAQEQKQSLANDPVQARLRPAFVSGGSQSVPSRTIATISRTACERLKCSSNASDSHVRKWRA